MSMKTFRKGLGTALATGLNIPFRDGYADGPFDTMDIGVTFPVRIAEVPANVLIEQQIVGVKVFKKIPKRVMPESPQDPGELEDLAELLQQVIEANETTLGPWFIRCAQIDFDLPGWCIEATIVATTGNLAV